MGWSLEQQNRLNKEREILSSYFPSFAFVNVGTALCLEGWMKTNKSNQYKIRLYVPADVPNSVPDVVITYPFPILDFYGLTLNAHGASSTMHLLGDRDGFPKICHYKQSHWNPNVTFYKVLIKVRIWLEALDGHRANGKALDYYLTHQV